MVGWSVQRKLELAADETVPREPGFAEIRHVNQAAGVNGLHRKRRAHWGEAAQARGKAAQKARQRGGGVELIRSRTLERTSKQGSG